MNRQNIFLNQLIQGGEWSWKESYGEFPPEEWERFSFKSDGGAEIDGESCNAGEFEEEFPIDFEDGTFNHEIEWMNEWVSEIVKNE